MSRPFIDSAAKKGSPKHPAYKRLSSSRKPENAIRFEVSDKDKKNLRLILPNRDPLLITKNNAIKLAHWLLDKATE